MAVLSPGVPTDLPIVQEMKKTGVSIIGEIELAYQFGKETCLPSLDQRKDHNHLFAWRDHEKCQRRSLCGGNIGNPYTKVAGEMTDQAVTVAEVSSFQLETICEFRPR